MIADKNTPKVKPNLFEEKECFISSLFCLYMRKVELLGLSKPIEKEDIFQWSNNFFNRKNELLESFSVAFKKSPEVIEVKDNNNNEDLVANDSLNDFKILTGDNQNYN